jgi:hypothetical protein
MLDFRLLSMTELRTRPGEILDRVADDGEAFLIERNGSRKACLVPLTVFLPDISPSRIADELHEFERNGVIARTTITPEREIAFRCRHRLAADEVDIAIVLPQGYPNACPRVYADSLNESAPPHRWADGALCIFGVMSSWNPGKHTAFSALTLARRWLQRYENWKKTGEWPQAGIDDEQQ